MKLRPRPAGSAFDRARLGLTGLAAVFLLVLLVAVLGQPASPPGKNSEPLAKLGVAPAGPDTGMVAPAPAPTP